MKSDSSGNILYNVSNHIYLKLVGEENGRELGVLDEDNQVLIVKRNSAKHLFKKTNSYGFNDILLKSATKFDKVKLIIDSKDKYIIPVDAILTKGEYMNFKQQGFELQIFLSLDTIKIYQI